MAFGGGCARDEGRSAWERTWVLRVLPRLQVVTAQTLEPFLASSDVPTAEAALGALAWLDRPEPALPRLLERLDGDRARVAMYAVPRVAKLLPPAALATALEAMLAQDKLKVTVHKELVRMLGTFRGPRSPELLWQQWERPKLHRDVRIAVGHAARRMLDDEAAWKVLDALAVSAEAYVAASLLDERRDALPLEERARYAGLILQVSRHPDLHVRRQALGALPRWSAGMEERVAKEAAARVVDLEGAPEWREAAQALVEVTREEMAFEQVTSCAAALVSTPVKEGQDAGRERDVPGRQRVRALCRMLLALPRPALVRLRSQLADLGGVLLNDESLWPESAALRLSGLPWGEPERAASGVLKLASEVGEEPAFAVTLATLVAEAVRSASAEWTGEAVLEVADRVVEEAPLAGVALVSAAGQRLHWREDAAGRLRALRRHPSAAVRAAAYATHTVDE